MYRLSSIVLLVLGLAHSLYPQSPHGATFKVNCGACHTSDGWAISSATWQQREKATLEKSKTTGWKIDQDTTFFQHNKTSFALTGQHAQVDCRACHQSLVFSEASPECISCHTDMHDRTAGADCARCHTTQNWLVDNVRELHQDNGFPLLGAHALSDCVDCHKSETRLRFDRIGNDCINCHRTDYLATTKPNHTGAGFSTNCSDCHDVARFDWHTDKVSHDFFPLTKGHDIADCARCHTNGAYSNTPSDCISCHKTDYETAANPNHTTAKFSQNCLDCHTTDLDWMPAKFTQHDADYFPIYSGKHQGTWDQCADCHTNASNYKEFTCITCHVNPETDNEHQGVNGYSYNSPACLACHPTGNGGDAFDHNKTHFPLTGAHQTAECLQCHAAGYAGTPTNCAACHTPEYNQSANPNHVALAIPTDCAACHTTNAWEPATFAIHNNYYPLNGAHAAMANDCAACHKGDYNSTPNTCAGCHITDYNQTTNPNHKTANFPTDCKTCHGETAWMPSTFNHNSVYPLNGAHKTAACNACHLNGNYNTPPPTTCVGCHQSDYNQTTNPKHSTAGFPTTCADCHTETAWEPANFDHDEKNFPIYSGKHKGKWDQCSDCHTTPGNYLVFSCTVCHTNPGTNNDHQGVPGYTYSSPACLACHPKGD